MSLQNIKRVRRTVLNFIIRKPIEKSFRVENTIKVRIIISVCRMHLP